MDTYIKHKSRYWRKVKLGIVVTVFLSSFLLASLGGVPFFSSAFNLTPLSYSPRAADNQVPTSNQFPDFEYMTYVENDKEISWVITDEADIAPSATWEARLDGIVIDSDPFTQSGQAVMIPCNRQEPQEASYVYTLYVDDGYTGLILLDEVHVTAIEAEWNYDPYDDFWRNGVPKFHYAGSSYDDLTLTTSHEVKNLADHSGAILNTVSPKISLGIIVTVNPSDDDGYYDTVIKWVEIDVMIRKPAPFNNNFWDWTDIKDLHSEYYAYAQHPEGGEHTDTLMYVNTYLRKYIAAMPIPIVESLLGGANEIIEYNERSDYFGVVQGANNKIAQWKFQYSNGWVYNPKDQEELALVIEFTPDLGITLLGETDFIVSYRVGLGDSLYTAGASIVSPDYTDTFTINRQEDVDIFTSNDFNYDLAMGDISPSLLSLKLDPLTCEISMTNLGNYIQTIDVSAIGLTVGTGSFDFSSFKIYPGPHNSMTAYYTVIPDRLREGFIDPVTITAENVVQSDSATVYVEVVRNYMPSITSPHDESFTEGVTSRSLAWTITDSFFTPLATFTVYLDEVLITTGPFSPGGTTDVTVNIPVLPAGVHTYRIIAEDGIGLSNTDEVFVWITPTSPMEDVNIVYSEDFEDATVGEPPAGWTNNDFGDRLDFHVYSENEDNQVLFVKDFDKWSNVYAYIDFPESVPCGKLYFDIWLQNPTPGLGGDFRVTLQDAIYNDLFSLHFVSRWQEDNYELTVLAGAYEFGGDYAIDMWHHFSIEFNGLMLSISVNGLPVLTTKSGGIPGDFKTTISARRLYIEAYEENAGCFFDNLLVAKTPVIFSENFNSGLTGAPPAGWTTTNDPAQSNLFSLITDDYGNNYLSVSDARDNSSVNGYTTFSSGVCSGVLEFDLYVCDTMGSDVMECDILLQKSTGETISTLRICYAYADSIVTFTIGDTTGQEFYWDSNWYHIHLGFDGSVLNLALGERDYLQRQFRPVPGLIGIAYDGGIVQRLRIETTVPTYGITFNFDNLHLTGIPVVFVENFDTDMIGAPPAGWTTFNDPDLGNLFNLVEEGAGNNLLYVSDSQISSSASGYTDLAVDAWNGRLEFDAFICDALTGSDDMDCGVMLQTKTGATICTLRFHYTYLTDTFIMVIQDNFGTTLFAENTWYHFRLDFEGNVLCLSVNEVAELTVIALVDDPVQRLYISTTEITYGMSCYFDDFVITGNPSTEPFNPLDIVLGTMLTAGTNQGVQVGEFSIDSITVYSTTGITMGMWYGNPDPYMEAPFTDPATVYFAIDVTNPLNVCINDCDHFEVTFSLPEGYQDGTPIVLLTWDEANGQWVIPDNQVTVNLAEMIASFRIFSI